MQAAPPWVSAQVTAALPVFCTVAENCCVAPTRTVDVGGATAIETARTIIVVEADLVGSAAEVAVIVTVRLLAGVAGAVYVTGAPLAVDGGEKLPHAPPEQDMLQMTPLAAESLATVAVNCAVPPACTVVLVAERLMAMIALAPPPLHPETNRKAASGSRSSFFQGLPVCGRAR